MYQQGSQIDSHQHAAQLIPWYVNGTLDEGEAARLSAHLDGCASCRRDYEAQLRLYEAMQADTTLVFAAEPSFKKLMARIGSHEDAGELATGGQAVIMPSAMQPRPRRKLGRAAGWLAAAVVLEGLGLGYGAWTWHTHEVSVGSGYVTLSSPQPSYRNSPRIRIVFRSGLSVGGLGAILHGSGAHIIDGPTDANVYTLGFAAADVTPQFVQQRIATLRASADVLFAEPLGGPDGSPADRSQ